MNLSLTQLRLESGPAVIAIDVAGVAGPTDAPLLKKTLAQALQQGYRTVIINLARVRDMDQACWERLVTAARRLQGLKGRLVLLHCPDTQYSLLVARRWERCFLLPKRRRGDAEVLSAELRAWVSRQKSSEQADLRDAAGLTEQAAPGTLVTIQADDAPVRHSFLRHIGRRFGKPARLVLQGFFANAAEHAVDHRVDVVVAEDRIVALDHGGGPKSNRYRKKALEGGCGLQLMAAFGGIITPWEKGLRLEYIPPAKRPTDPDSGRKIRQ